MTTPDAVAQLPKQSGASDEQGDDAGLLKRYTLVLPDSVFQEVKNVADREHTTVLYVLRQFIKLGLLATRDEGGERGEFIFRRGGQDQHVLVL